MGENTARRERNERGATATEYGLLVGFIAMVIVVGVGFFGDALNTYYQGLGTWLTNVI